MYILVIIKSKYSQNDEEKTSFIIKESTFCYTRMLFDLKNTGATYQCLVNRMFTNQLGRNIEAYMDDIKST